MIDCAALDQGITQWFTFTLNISITAGILLLGALSVNLVKRISAGVRFLVIFAGLCGFLVLPFISVISSNFQTPAAVPVPAENRNLINQAQHIKPWFENITKPQIQWKQGHDESHNLPSFFQWFFPIWLGGFLILVFRLYCGLSGMRRLRRKTHHPERITLDLQPEFSLPVARAKIPIPVTCGLLRTLVVLPEDFDNWPREQQQTILYHEAAHVKRHDNLANLLAQIVAAFYWFHPLVWIALSQMRLNREKACDDWVLNAGFKPSAYAAVLFNAICSNMRSNHSKQDLLILHFHSKGEKRLKHILNSKASHQLPGVRTKVLLILIALTLWVPLSTCHLFAGSDEIGALQAATSSEGGIEAPTANQNVVKLTFQTKDHQKISLSGLVNDFPLGWPEQTKIHQVTSPFGTTLDPILKQERFHSGVDIKCPLGTPIIATAAGKVMTAEFREGYGKMIILRHADLTTLYAKLADWKVKPGDIVKKGDLIAYSGNTGRSTGPHLHYEIHYNSEPIDPERFCNFQTETAGQFN